MSNPAEKEDEMTNYVPHLIDARHARRFVSPARLAVWAIEKERAGKPEQAARLFLAAAVMVPPATPTREHHND